jgi:hypothetical protein
MTACHCIGWHIVYNLLSKEKVLIYLVFSWNIVWFTSESHQLEWASEGILLDESFFSLSVETKPEWKIHQIIENKASALRTAVTASGRSNTEKKIISVKLCFICFNRDRNGENTSATSRLFKSTSSIQYLCGMSHWYTRIATWSNRIHSNLHCAPTPISSITIRICRDEFAPLDFPNPRTYVCYLRTLTS